MSFNPLEFSYKVYPESGKATFVSRLSSYIERMLLIFGVIVIAIVVFDTPNNVGEAIIAVFLMLGGAWFIHNNKEAWCENILKKEMSTTSTVSDASNIASSSRAATGKKFCCNCGSPIEPNAHFCTNCGHKIT